MSELLSRFVIDVYANGILSFLTVILFVELFIRVLCSKNYRLNFFCRLIPFLKLPWDLLNYNISNWAWTKGINPEMMPENSRFISASLGCGTVDFFPILSTFDVGFHLETGETFSIADCLTGSLNASTLFLIASCLLCCSALKVLMLLGKYAIASKKLRKIIHTSQPFEVPLENLALTQSLEKKKVTIVCSSLTSIPFAAGLCRRLIVFPSSLVMSCSVEEVEGILAHELEHLRWHDGTISILLELIGAIFFYLPLGRVWKKKIEREREVSCDMSCERYGISSQTHSIAIYKTLLQAHQSVHPFTAIPFVQKKHEAVKRVEILLLKRKNLWSPLRIIQGLLLTYALLALMLGRVWVF